MPSILSGELRLDLTTPATANDLARILEDLDSQGVERDQAVITIQPAVPHVGELNGVDPYARPKPLGMQLVATWTV